MISIGYSPLQNNNLTEINLPLSKSISNRALILSFLVNVDLDSLIISDADDSILLKEKLQFIAANKNSGKFIEINVNNAGTAMRFLTSLLAITDGNWILTGNERMQQRPVGELVNALTSLGADIEYSDKNGFPPLKIKGKQIEGGKIEINANISSQFITSLLLIAPFLKNGLSIHLKGNISSEPYISMTLKMLASKGVIYKYDDNKIIIQNCKLNSKAFQVENDWSSAAFWYEIVAFSKNLKVKIKDLKNTDIQGDTILSSIFENFGVHTDFEEDGLILSKSEHLTKDFCFDFSMHPDLAQSVAITAAGLGIQARLSGLESLKIKETDRLKALYIELTKLNCNVGVENDNTLIITPSKLIVNQTVNTYNDHRMIMSFAPLAILSGEISFDNIEDVSKSFPDFWKEVNKIGLMTRS